MDLRMDLDAVFVVHRTMPNRGPGGDAFWGLVHIGMRLGWERSGRGTLHTFQLVSSEGVQFFKPPFWIRPHTRQ